MNTISFQIILAMALTGSAVFAVSAWLIRYFLSREQNPQPMRRPPETFLQERRRIVSKPGIICSLPIYEAVREEMRLY
jgi:hypothetical protein